MATLSPLGGPKRLAPRRTASRSATSLLLSRARHALALTPPLGHARLPTHPRSSAAKVYGKTLELNEQYDVVPKAKSALDTVSTAAANLDANYGVTAKIDDQLKLSQSVEKVTAKVDELKETLTSKVDDLKSKASATE